MLDPCLTPLLANQSPSAKARLRKTGIIIPTYNAAGYWPRLRAALDEQGVEKKQVLIVDSTSTDNTRELAQEAGYRLLVIPQSSFRHGATRQMAAGHLGWAEFLVFLTQDALPSGPDVIPTLLASFDSAAIGGVYGRQTPRQEADAIERHGRLFNYPSVSAVRNLGSREALGFRAACFSNSFAAYRRSALNQVGGFPKNVIVSEEVTVAARMLLAGWNIAYCAEAEVVHSHPLTLRQEFCRYFDIAVHHSRERWLIEEFGKAGGEGFIFVLSELRYLLNTAPQLIPIAFLRNLSKWVAYQAGLRESLMPLKLKRALSNQPTYWQAREPMHIVKR